MHPRRGAQTHQGRSILAGTPMPKRFFLPGSACPSWVAKFPKLKIVCEHITTKVAVEFVRKVPSNVAATITPQHLIYTVGNLLQGFKYHLFCLPLIKFEEDRAALREAATSGNPKFFAGTDSAPHDQGHRMRLRRRVLYRRVPPAALCRGL